MGTVVDQHFLRPSQGLIHSTSTSKRRLGTCIRLLANHPQSISDGLLGHNFERSGWFHNTSNYAFDWYSSARKSREQDKLIPFFL